MLTSARRVQSEPVVQDAVRERTSDSDPTRPSTAREDPALSNRPPAGAESNVQQTTSSEAHEVNPVGNGAINNESSETNTDINAQTNWDLLFPSSLRRQVTFGNSVAAAVQTDLPDFTFEPTNEIPSIFLDADNRSVRASDGMLFSELVLSLAMN